jgi:putative toxin-antitoxin system antitoxin component (TIGR02293 family)
MSVSIAAQRSAKKGEQPRAAKIAAFWRFSSNRQLLHDSERLLQIKKGFSIHIAPVFRITFNLQKREMETLLNASISTLSRRRREQKNLDPIASERLDRIAIISNWAKAIFESEESAVQWMSRPNKALGNALPIMLCETEIGARQVRRALYALEWGGVA